MKFEVWSYSHLLLGVLVEQHVSGLIDTVTGTEDSTQASEINSDELKHAAVKVLLLLGVAGVECKAAHLDWWLGWLVWVHDEWMRVCSAISR